jgi:Uma2 family endonuclease
MGQMNSVLAESMRALRRDEYDRMVELGFFADERVELLEGMLVAMSPQSARHATVVSRLNLLLAPALLNRAEVRIQSPFGAGGDSEPEPHVAVLPVGDYTRRHPDRALLIIEVAESSLRNDRLVKTRLYAEAAVPEYWVVDLENDQVHVHRQPAAGNYQQINSHARGASLTLLAFPEILVATDLLLPPR